VWDSELLRSPEFGALHREEERAKFNVSFFNYQCAGTVQFLAQCEGLD